MTKLAFLGGRPVRTAPLPAYRTIGAEEQRAVHDVLASGVLSKYLGTWTPDFYGGPKVQELERTWERHFGVRHAVSVNSATSGLFAAVGAARIQPGDEVIVSPYTMSASVTCVPVYGGVPVFADIDPRTFCLDPASVRERITKRTKAIVAVDIFGQPAAMDEIMEIAAEHDLVVIEDAAQAPGARSRGRYAGTLGHMGVFSLNYHKTIHSGEGGVVVTEDPDLAERLQLIRNHAESVVEAKGTKDLTNLLGYNYRMTEIEAAIALEQLRKLGRLLAARQKAAGRLTKALRGVAAFVPPHVEPRTEHGWYVYAVRYLPGASNVARATVAKALAAEGVPVAEGYVKPIYLTPLYQRRAHWSLATPAARKVSYARGLCPVAERMHFTELLYHPHVHADLTDDDLDDVAEAFRKVGEGLTGLAAPAHAAPTRVAPARAARRRAR